MAPQSKGGQKLKKKTIEHYKRPVLKHPESSFYVFFFAIRVPM